LKTLVVRLVVSTVVIVLSGLVSREIIAEFVVGTFTDPRIEPTVLELISAANYSPHSAAIFERLARTESTGVHRDLANAEVHAVRATQLSRNNFEFQLLVARIREIRGDVSGAEQSYQKALLLAPFYAEIRWKLGNLQIRQGRIGEGIEQLRIVAGTTPLLVPAMLDIVWSASNNDVAAMKHVVEGTPNQLALARFLAAHDRLSDAEEITASVDSGTISREPNISSLIDLFMERGRFTAAYGLWLKLHGEPADISQGVWNGGFESMADANSPSQFSWHLRDSGYARVRIDNKVGHASDNSLLIDFAGKDTTRLDNEIKKLIVLNEGGKLELEFFVKTERFRSPNGLKVTVSDWSGKSIAVSNPIPTGNNDWTRMTVNFSTSMGKPRDPQAVTLSVQLQPHFVYEEATTGKIWMDDFAIRRLGS
jgi:tetratricopeptide (TPR) repeat protein